MDALENVRDEIDSIDKQLTELFEKRMEVVLKVAQHKKENNIPILNKVREEEVIKKNLQRLKNKAFEKPQEEFLKSIMSISRKLQAREIFEYNTYSGEEREGQLQYAVSNEATCLPKREEIYVGYQGVSGSYSEEALFEHFGDKVDTKNFKEFEDVFVALKNNEIDYGVLPIENSSTGGISEVYDLIRKYGFFIVGERIIKVNHNLLGIKGANIQDIKEVYSHIQGLQQCREFLKEHSHWNCIPYRNTAASAEMVKGENNKEKAAIGSRRAAEIYGLDIIEHDINYNKNNYTKFIIIGKNLELEKDYNKITVILSLPHKAGALYNILSIFAENNLSMVKIESRPIIDKSFEYFFYIDFEGNLEEQVVKEAIRAIRDNSYDFKLLGNYKAHNINE